MAILDPPSDIEDVEQLTRVASGPAPAADSGTGTSSGSGSGSGKRSSSSSTPAEGAGGGDADPDDEPGMRPPDSDKAAFYFPQIVGRNPITGERVPMAPSGHMAGIWARTDTTRGVHKAPANEPVRGALDLRYAVTREEQAILNPAGVNCIRYFPSGGILVWGARTLKLNSEFAYLNVRRLTNMLQRVDRAGHDLDRVRAERLQPVALHNP